MGTEVIPKLTYEEFRQLPDDGKRYELVGGEVRLTPAPNTKHQFVVHNLDMAIARTCRRTSWERSGKPRSM